jgi:hypothetical protein
MKRNLIDRGGRAVAALALLLAGLAGSLLPAGATGTPAPNPAAADKALAWMRAQQGADGSFPGFGAGSTADAVYAFAARGVDSNTVTNGGKSPIDYLASKAGDLTKTAGGTAKLALAVALAGHDPRNFAGLDLSNTINSFVDPATGHYGTDVTGQALVVLALVAMQNAGHPQTFDWLLAQQGPEGGWAFGGDQKPGAADTNTTGLVLQALASVSARPSFQPQIDKALAYLHTQQNADGGFPYAQGDPNGSASDANSTALVVMALVAVGEDPAGAAWSQAGHTPAAALLTFQNAGGAFRYQMDQPDDNGGATYQAVPALLQRALPFAPVAPPTSVPPTGIPTPGMPTTGTPAPAPLWPLGVALAVLAGGLWLRRRAVR